MITNRHLDEIVNLKEDLAEKKAKGKDLKIKVKDTKKKLKELKA